jgi:phosphatidylinositol glycan class S
LFASVAFSKVRTTHYVTCMASQPPSESLRDPAKLFYQTDKTRRSIVIAYWTIIILAIPLWWYSTSIERLSLPSHHVHQQAEYLLQLPVRICLQTVDEHFSDSVRTSLADNISHEPQRWRGLAVEVFGKANCGMPFIYTLPANEIMKAAEETPKDNCYTIIFKDGPISIQNRNLYFPPSCESTIL